MKTPKTSFVLYHSFKDAFDLLSMQERGELITAIFEHETEDGITHELSPFVGMAFTFIKSALERDARAYKEKCEINAINGKKGGRPRKNSCQKTERFFSKPKKADTDTEYDTETEIDTDTVTGTEYDTEYGTECDTEAHMGAYEDSVPQCSAHSSASASPSHTQSSTPCLSEYLKNLLGTRGVSIEYCESRLERAWEYARRLRKNVADVLTEWYRRDERAGAYFSADRRAEKLSKSSERRAAGDKAEEINEWFYRRLDALCPRTA